MKNELSKIRREAGVAYAKAHPEVPLRVISTALGYSPKTDMLSGALSREGLNRPRGAGSPAFDKSKLKHGPDPKYDRTAMLAMLKQGMLQTAVAKVLGCHVTTVSQFARKNGLGVGKGTTPHDYQKLHTDDELREFFAVPRPGSYEVLAKELGFSGINTLRKAMIRVGVERVK